MRRRQEALAVLAVLAACGRGPMRGRTDPRLVLGRDPLGARYLRLVGHVEPRGYRLDGTPERFLLLEGDGAARERTLDAGSCYTFIGIATPGVRDLNLSLYDGAGEPIVDDHAPESHAIVHVCPQEPRTYYAVVRVVRGEGVALVGTFRSRPTEAQGLDGIWDGVSLPASPSNAIAPRLAAVEGRLQPRGFHRAESWSGMLGQGESDRHTATLRAGSCWAFAAVGAESLEDLDVFVYDPLGAEVARDIRTDRQPIVELCPPASGRYVVEVKAYQGSGEFAAAAYQGPRAAAASSAPPDASSPIDLAAEMRRLGASMEKRGYRPLVLSPGPATTVEAPLANGETRDHAIVLPPGCFAIVVRGGSGVADLDATLRDAAGDVVDRDVGPDPSGIVRACSLGDHAYTLSVRAYGAGTYAIARFRSTTAAADLLSLRVAEATALLGSEGFSPEGPPNGGTLRTGDAWSHEVAFEAGACYGVIGAGGAGVGDLDLFVYDRLDRLVGSDTGPEAGSLVRVCPTESGPFRIEVRMFNGEGPFLVSIARAGARRP